MRERISVVFPDTYFSLKDLRLDFSTAKKTGLSKIAYYHATLSLPYLSAFAHSPMSCTHRGGHVTSMYVAGHALPNASKSLTASGSTWVVTTEYGLARVIFMSTGSTSLVPGVCVLNGGYYIAFRQQN